MSEIFDTFKKTNGQQFVVIILTNFCTEIIHYDLKISIFKSRSLF